MSSLRRFNQNGLSAFRVRLGSMPTLANVGVADLLEREDLTEIIHADVIVRVRPFANRRHAAEVMDGLFTAAGVSEADARHDVGLWAWLAAAWLEELAPLDAAGHRPIRAQHRWIPQVQDYKTYYRHLLLGPYRIYCLYRDMPETAMVVLASKVEKPGELVEQLASRLDYVTNPHVIGLATELYYDAESHAFKRGAAGKTAGSVRRLTDVLDQLDLTWDFRETGVEQLKELLPVEFDRFRG